MNLEQRLKHLKVSQRVTYDQIGKIYCPCLSNYVIFNAQGFHHMSYDGGGRARTLKEEIYKLTLIPLAIPVVKFCTTIDEYKKEKQPKNRKVGALQKDVEYWSLIANVGKNRDVKAKVILKRVGTGNIIFWSIMKLKK